MFALRYIMTIGMCLPIVASSTNITCIDGEYLHIKTRQCTRCTDCNGTKLLTLVPCRANGDAICGTEWGVVIQSGWVKNYKTTLDKVKSGDTKVTSGDAKVKSDDAKVKCDKKSQSRKMWDTIQYICIGLLICTSLVTTSVVGAYIIHRRRQRRRHQTQTTPHFTRSLDQLAKERYYFVSDENDYIKMKDLGKKFHSPV